MSSNGKTLRTKETERRYVEHKKRNHSSGGCTLCGQKAIKGFKYWKLVENDFPYDLIADPHHMLVIKRHTREEGITQDEWDEYERLKSGSGYINQNYTFIFESTRKTMTLPDHFHLQLIVVKDNLE